MGWKTETASWILVTEAAPELFHRVKKLWTQTFCHNDVSFWFELVQDFHGPADMHDGDAHGKC